MINRISLLVIILIIFLSCNNEKTIKFELKQQNDKLKKAVLT